MQLPVWRLSSLSDTVVDPCIPAQSFWGCREYVLWHLQALHTSVLPLGTSDLFPLEVIIRTAEMHRIAEYGIAGAAPYLDMNHNLVPPTHLLGSTHPLPSCQAASSYCYRSIV